MSNTTKVLKTSRGSRIWLEGSKLSESGFTPKTRYNIEFVQLGVIHLTVNPEGKRKVTNSTRKGQARPIIDIEKKSFSNFASVGAEILIQYGRNEIHLLSAIEPKKAHINHWSIKAIYQGFKRA